MVFFSVVVCVAMVAKDKAIKREPFMLGNIKTAQAPVATRIPLEYTCPVDGLNASYHLGMDARVYVLYALLQSF